MDKVNPSQDLDDKKIFYKLNQDVDHVKTRISSVPFASNLTVYDVSLKGRGNKEDHLFAINKFYRDNVRRGLSFIEEDSKGISILRRGLEKFFDLKAEYLEYLEGTFQGKFYKDDEKLFHVIFDEVEETLRSGGKVTVYKTEKANGENAQVGYNAKYDAWVIASKNVSILVRNKNEIEEYIKQEKSRYRIVSLIADVWFKILEKMDNVNELKKELNGRTLIGEYCGHPRLQHLVEYKDITIYFFALVDLRGERTCNPIQVTDTFLHKFGLPKVKIIPRKECTDKKELIEILREIIIEVAENTIEEDAEGAVIYFETKRQDKVEVLSLCKVKTLEYRLYRKLREKLKSTIARRRPVETQMNAYMRESQRLAKSYNTPQPLDYYFDIARLALEFVYSRPDIAKKLGISNRYIDFLNIIKKCKEKETKPRTQDFQKMLDTASVVSEEESEEEEEEEEDKPKEKGRKSIDDKREHRRKGTSESEEEKKIDEIENIGHEKGAPKRIVIITPPLYFDIGIKEKIKNLKTGMEIETEWNENQNPPQQNFVVILNKFPHISNPAGLKEHTAFIMVGFTPDVLKSTEKKLTSLAGQEDFSQFSNEESEFIKKGNFSVSLEELFKSREQFIESVKEPLPDNFIEIQLGKPEKILSEITKAIDNLNKVKEPSHKTKEETSSKKKKVLFMFSIGLPGMGKTTYMKLLRKLLEERDCALTIISSDKVRLEIMDELRQKNPKMSHHEAFEKSSKTTKKRYYDYVEDAILNTRKIPQSFHVVFLDKNHPPNIIKEAIDFARKSTFTSKFNIKVAVMKPFCIDTFKTKHNFYPFSLSFFLTCLKRSIAREGHETLVGDEMKITSVLFGFLNFYKNFDANYATFTDLGADLVVELPFAHEDIEIDKQLNDEVGTLVGNVLHRLRGFEVNEEKVQKLLEGLEKLQVELKSPSPDLMNQKSVENLDKCFELFKV